MTLDLLGHGFKPHVGLERLLKKIKLKKKKEKRKEEHKSEISSERERRPDYSEFKIFLSHKAIISALS